MHGSTGRWQGGYRGPASTPWHRVVCATAYAVYAYGGTEGERFLPRFDEALFPYAGPSRLDVRLTWAAAQRVFGLHPPTSKGGASKVSARVPVGSRDG